MLTVMHIKDNSTLLFGHKVTGEFALAFTRALLVSLTLTFLSTSVR